MADLKLISTPFEQWAADRGYDITPAEHPDCRVYASPITQDAFEVWQARGEHIARILTESTLDTEALREKILAGIAWNSCHRLL